ncbi:MAG: SpoIVB peptidase [Anaerovoracaceae bacterium]
MKGFMKKGALVLCGLLLSIAVIGQIFPQADSEANAPVVAEKVLVPGGQSVGVKMDVRGVLVVGLEEIESDDGEKINPGLLGGLQIGDTILEIDGKEVYRADEVQSIVNKIKGVVKLKVKRNNEIISVNINPVVSKTDGLYKLGIWVKDKTAGIGTLTYYDPSNSTFGALGHGIVDAETSSILPVESGLLLESQVQEVKEGKNGKPGEIRGIFYHASDPLGSLERNSNFGVFGVAYHPIENPVYSKPIAVGTKEQVEKGKAYILSTLSNNEIRKFEIEIEKVEKQTSQADKSMVIKVTDEELLEESGGIVQGMSGSPIIQNDRIVGAVTHVFVNDPQRGYGIFIEWMLEESDSVEQ